MATAPSASDELIADVQQQLKNGRKVTLIIGGIGTFVTVEAISVFSFANDLVQFANSTEAYVVKGSTILGLRHTA